MRQGYCSTLCCSGRLRRPLSANVRPQCAVCSDSYSVRTCRSGGTACAWRHWHSFLQHFSTRWRDFSPKPLGWTSQRMRRRQGRSRSAMFFGAVVFAPVFETFMLAGLLGVLLSTSLRPTACAAISAVLWGGFHGLFGALWFFGTAWSFFVFSCGYISWRRASFRHGFLAAAVPHALVNSIAILLLWSAKSAV